MVLVRTSILFMLLPLLMTGCAAISSLVESAQAPPESAAAVTVVAPTPVAADARGARAAEKTDEGSDLPLLFVSDRGKSGTTDIYQINADGSGLIRLTNDPATDRDPSWSPDLKQIAFASNRSGSSQIFLMSSEDYTVEQLTEHPGGAGSPTWSPDGKRIAFVEPSGKSNRLHIASLEAGGEEVTFSVDAEAIASPSWSPLGDMIAFSAKTSSANDAGAPRRDIFAYDMGKNILINLTNSEFIDDNPAWSPDGKRLIFQSNRDGDDNIYIMNANGSLPTPLTTADAADVEPTWSNDGQQIAFSSDRDGKFNIYVMHGNGSEQQPLAPYAADDRQPNWPQRIATASNELLYAGGILTDFRDLHLTSAEGTTRTQLTESDNSDDTIPDWSPDGKQIVFTSSRSGNYDIYTMHADGTNTTKITSNDGDDKHPSWSPDGRRIVFESKQGDVDWDVWIMDADGNNMQNLTADANANDGNPTWSPDGSEVAFSSNRHGNYEIYVMKVDGSEAPIRLTETDANDFHPDWSPDGSLIAFRSNSPSTGLRQLIVMSRDGDSPRPLFPSQSNDDTPAWSLDGQRIAFASDRNIEEELSPDGTYRIYIYDLNTGTLTAVTHGNRDGRYPAWRPGR